MNPGIHIEWLLCRAEKGWLGSQEILVPGCLGLLVLASAVLLVKQLLPLDHLPKQFGLGGKDLCHCRVWRWWRWWRSLTTTGTTAFTLEATRRAARSPDHLKIFIGWSVREFQPCKRAG
jgi:hypothetical protein